MTHTLEAAMPLPHRSRGRNDPPIVLIHGFGADRLSWSAMMQPLAAARRTLALDLPGHGAVADWPEAVDAKRCADAVIATLDAVGVARASLVGHSLGGAVAAIIGLKRPELVERMVLLAPGGFGREMNAPLLRRYAAARDEATLADVLTAFCGPDTRLPDALPRLAAAQRKHPSVTASLARVVEAICIGDGQGVLPLDALAAAPFPVSLIWGTADAVLPVSHALKAPPAFARHILPGIGHMPHMEAPEMVTDIVLKTVTGRGPG